MMGGLRRVVPLLVACIQTVPGETEAWLWLRSKAPFWNVFCTNLSGIKGGGTGRLDDVFSSVGSGSLAPVFCKFAVFQTVLLKLKEIYCRAICFQIKLIQFGNYKLNCITLMK